LPVTSNETGLHRFDAAGELLDSLERMVISTRPFPKMRTEPTLGDVVAILKNRYRKLIWLFGSTTKNAPIQAEMAPEAPTIGI
jgi:hypothetical protein